MSQGVAVWTCLPKTAWPPTYQDYGDYEFFSKGGFWQKQLHIYNYPLYYIDYCIAQICAMQYKVMMDENYDAAWASYLKLCELSASDFFTNLVDMVGLKNPFKEGCVKEIVEKLEKKIG